MQSCCFATDSYLVTTCLFSQTSIEKKIDAGKGAWEEGSFAFSLLPSLDAPRTHLIISINHSANTEKLLCTSPVLLILTYSFLDRLVAVTIVVA